MAQQDIQVQLPAGMTETQLKALVTKYIPQREKSKNRDKAKREAVQNLITKHQVDYDLMLTAAKKKFGVS